MPNDAHEVYLNTIERMEPDITMVDRDAALASIAISLKRLADTAEWSARVRYGGPPDAPRSPQDPESPAGKEAPDDPSRVGRR